VATSVYVVLIPMSPIQEVAPIMVAVHGTERFEVEASKCSPPER
jgi:hypothetical protein